MGNRLARLEDYIQRALPEYIAGKLVPRGIWIPADPFMRGNLRFARLTGEYMAVVSPDNTMHLAARAPQGESAVTVDRLLVRHDTGDTWLVPACLVRIEGREVKKVSDFDVDDGTIAFTEPLDEDHAANVEVTLHGVPIFLNGSYAKGATVIVVKGDYEIFGGDQVLIDTIERDVSEALFDSIDGITGQRVYQLTLAKGLHRAVVDQETIHLRAHPAYSRQRCQLPAIPRFERLLTGPLLLDWVSGTLVGEETFRETMTIQLLGASFLAVGGKITAAQNQPVIRAPILAETMLQWDLANGKVNWREDDKKVIATLTADAAGRGRWRAVRKLDPPFPTGQITEWRIVARAVVPPGAGPTSLIVTAEPGEQQVAALPANVQVTVPVTLPSSPVTRLHVAIAGDPGAVVELGDWNIVGSRAVGVDYSIVAHATGVFRWASTGLLVKPMFRNLDYVRPTLDVNAQLDGGFLLLG